MGKHDAAIRSTIEPMLAAGEDLLAVARVNYNGTMPAASLPGSAGRSSDPEAQVTFPTSRQMALGLTGGRLIVFSLGFSGKPKSHIGDVPLSAVDEVEEAGLRTGGLRLLLRSGARVDLEYLAGEAGEPFTLAISSLVEPPPPRDPTEGALPSWDAQPEEEGEPAAGAARDDDWVPPPVPPPPGGWDEPAPG